MTRRILWLTPDKPANISVGRQRVAFHLSDSGYKVTLRGTTPKTVLQSLRTARSYDAIVGTTRAGAIAGATIGTLSNTPVVIDHVDPIAQFYETSPRWLARVVDRLETVSFRLSEHVLYVYEEESDRVATHAPAHSKTNLGVDYERFANPTADVLERALEVFPDEFVDKRVAVYIGGLEPIYNVQPLLASVEMLEEPWRLLLVGTGTLEETVRRTAAATDRISYLGTVPHEVVPGVLHRADVGVSLVDDPQTLKVLEYGSAGLPVVQRRGRAQERFGDRVTYCDPTPEAIARAIVAADGTDTEPLETFVRSYDWAEIATTYGAAIEQAIDDSSQP